MQAIENLYKIACARLVAAELDAQFRTADAKIATAELAAASEALKAREGEFPKEPLPLVMVLGADKPEPGSVTRHRAAEQAVEFARTRVERARLAETCALARAADAKLEVQRAGEWKTALTGWVQAVGGSTSWKDHRLPALAPTLLELGLERPAVSSPSGK